MYVSIRPTAVAGAFYPEAAPALENIISLMLMKAPRSASYCPKAIIAPHAGYIYSGPIAASVYAPLRRLRGKVARVVLLGPTHRVAVNGLALPTSKAFATPMGEIAIDQQAIATIRDLPQIVFSDAAHAQEHSLEVQLPFLQISLGVFSLVPLAVGEASPALVAEVLDHLWGGEETLIVVSSDLSHYLPYDQARQVDEQTAQHILDLDPTIQHQQACGSSPINGLLLAAKNHGLNAQLIDLRNSGDTAGDKARVVGYGAFGFHEVHHAH